MTPIGPAALSKDVIGTTERHQAAPANEFEAFVTSARPQLLRVMIAHYGTEIGPEVTADALAYAWQHWPRLRTMDNPAGYLYRVAQSAFRKHTRWRRTLALLPHVPTDVMPDIEPGLPAALAKLSAPQRTAVVLVYAHGWTLADAAAAMDISISTLRNHLARGLAQLRSRLEVEAHG